MPATLGPVFASGSQVLPRGMETRRTAHSGVVQRADCCWTHWALQLVQQMTDRTLVPVLDSVVGRRAKTARHWVDSPRADRLLPHEQDSEEWLYWLFGRPHLAVEEVSLLPL